MIYSVFLLLFKYIHVLRLHELQITRFVTSTKDKGYELFWIIVADLQAKPVNLYWVDCVYPLQSVDNEGLRTFERASLLEKRASLLKELVLKKICVSKNSFFFLLGWGHLHIEVCMGFQVLFQCHMTWFYWLIFIDEILHLWQDILNISFQASTFHWPKNI